MYNDDLDSKKLFLVDCYIHYYFYFDNFRKLYQIQIIIIFHIIIITEGHPYHIILQDLINQQGRNTRIILNYGRKKSRQMEIRYFRESELKRFKQLQRIIILSIRSYCAIFKNINKNCSLLQSFVNIYKSNKENISKDVSPQLNFNSEQFDTIDYAIYG
ncbi:unnamed protein product [Paramecium pentaurelia]|uniref:Uncharacterized protein n=1 Tax=Paramecium pentaurelia TaxID=43138 RepID=A0A8S1UME9_9CILI|nr:unnamed protein product [Paramecium pentaurelia]